jgi:two-component system response regulator CpxR
VLRRSSLQTVGDKPAHELLNVDDISMDMHSRTVTRSGDLIDLTSVEFNVLEVLLKSAGNIVTREYLVRNAMGRRFMRFDRSIDMHVSNLRRKLGVHTDGSERIKTIRGSGYFYAHQHCVKR